uniref:Pentatricopeptide repeat-containing protein n=1 Tax=Oryza punctata TaxID=4537 RepID=A0A0E0JQV7_ORYPU
MIDLRYGGPGDGQLSAGFARPPPGGQSMPALGRGEGNSDVGKNCRSSAPSLRGRRRPLGARDARLRGKGGDAALDVSDRVHRACPRVLQGPRCGGSPKGVTYTALMHGYFIHGQREKGFSLFEDMRRAGVEPNLYT